MTHVDEAQHRVEKPVRPGYELTDISTRVVVVFATALVAAGVIIHVLVWALFAYLGQATAASYSRQYPLASTGAAPLPPAPTLQVRPREDLREMRAEEDRILSSYGWVDANAGIVRIPIDRAMQLVLQRGLPTRTASKGAGPAPADAARTAGAAMKPGAARGPTSR